MTTVNKTEQLIRGAFDEASEFLAKRSPDEPLGLIVIVSDKTGAFQLINENMHLTTAIGLLDRAALEIHLNARSQFAAADAADTKDPVQ